MHTDFNIRSLLPDFAIVNSAHDSDPKSSWELCAGMKAGEVVVFDKVYVDFKPLKTLSGRDVSWVPGQRRTCSMKLWDNSHCRALCLRQSGNSCEHSKRE